MIVWTQDKAGAPWTQVVLPFSAPVWRVSWSLTGNMLAVASGDQQAALWKQALDGSWQCVRTRWDWCSRASDREVGRGHWVALRHASPLHVPRHVACWIMPPNTALTRPTLRSTPPTPRRQVSEMQDGASEGGRAEGVFAH